MNFPSRRAGTLVALMTLAAAAACSRQPNADSSLQADLKAAAAGGDLELASHSATSNLVVSPLEATPSAVPQRAAPHRATVPTARPATRVANRQTPAPRVAVQRAPERVAAERSAPATSRSEPAPTAQPVAAPPQQPATRQSGVYKSEAEIFRQMPWIRP